MILDFNINMPIAGSRALERFQKLSKKISYSPPSSTILSDIRDADALGCSSLLAPSATHITSTRVVISKRKLFGSVSSLDSVPSSEVCSPLGESHTGTTPEFSMFTLSASPATSLVSRRCEDSSVPRNPFSTPLSCSARVRSCDSDIPVAKRKRCNTNEQQCNIDLFDSDVTHSDGPKPLGNFSGEHCLPTVPGYHSDLNYIAPHTLKSVLDKSYQLDNTKLLIVDCRYPYEFNGGHIQGAINLYTKEAIHEQLIQPSSLHHTGRTIIVFHCEFSSERGPKMCRFLREQDRAAHTDSYPHLYYPEIYVMHGGYKAFYEQCGKAMCEPQAYRPMLHDQYHSQLKQYRKETKRWGRYNSWHGEGHGCGRKISFSNEHC